jgi:hypothetical protein
MFVYVLKRLDRTFFDSDLPADSVPAAWGNGTGIEKLPDSVGVDLEDVRRLLDGEGTLDL